MTSQELTRSTLARSQPDPESSTIEWQARILADLASAGLVTPTSLNLEGPMEFERYEALGSMLGAVGRSCRWWTGDWILFGEDTMADKYAQAMAATQLSESTLQNYASVCKLVPPSRRRIDVPFSCHAEVAKMTPNEQRHWLAIAAKEQLTQRDLRARIRDAERGDQDDDSGDGGSGSFTPNREDLETVARAIVAQASGAGDGRVVVPAELIHRLRAVLGADD